MTAAERADLAALGGLCAKATPGTWFYNGYSTVFADPGEGVDDNIEVCWVPPAYGDTAVGGARDDAAFIAAARTAVPALIADLGAALGLLRRLEWAGWALLEKTYCCPLCKQIAHHRHGCALKAFLARYPEVS